MTGAAAALGRTALDRAFLDLIRALAIRAGDEILIHFRTGAVAAMAKADGSPVTVADQAAEAIILAGLAALTPEIPVIAEEAVAAGQVPDVSGGVFWLVDPLDGTTEFLDRNGEFTVNLALIEDGVPVLGVVHAPVLGVGYAGRLGLGAWRWGADGAARPIAARPVPAAGVTVVSSRSHGDRATLERFLKTVPLAEEKRVGSSLKLCLLAAGEADLYPRFGRTMEWDIAAGHAVLLAAGGTVHTPDGLPLRYGKPGFENPDFMAEGCRAVTDRDKA